LFPGRQTLAPGATVQGFLDLLGEYDVYRLDAASTSNIQLDLTTKGAWAPVLMVYDGAGNQIPTTTTTGTYALHVQFATRAGQSYYIAVGSRGTVNGRIFFTLGATAVDGP